VACLHDPAAGASVQPASSVGPHLERFVFGLARPAPMAPPPRAGSRTPAAPPPAVPRTEPASEPRRSRAGRRARPIMPLEAAPTEARRARRRRGCEGAEERAEAAADRRAGEAAGGRRARPPTAGAAEPARQAAERGPGAMPPGRPSGGARGHAERRAGQLRARRGPPVTAPVKLFQSRDGYRPAHSARLFPRRATADADGRLGAESGSRARPTATSQHSPTRAIRRWCSRLSVGTLTPGHGECIREAV
jgi:hypothetical protein